MQLADGRSILGRSSDNTIPLPKEGVSRIHCAIFLQDDEWFVEDLGSSNGTKVNSDKITEVTALEERDVIRCGPARLTFHVKALKKRKKQREKLYPEHTVQANDPPESIQCNSCNGWLSITHRLPGDRMRCPKCDTKLTIPLLIPHDGSASATDENKNTENPNDPLHDSSELVL